MHPKYCPRCEDDWDMKPVYLQKAPDGVTLYCSGPYGEGCCCGFHYDTRTGKRYRYVDKRFSFFWGLLCMITLGRIATQKQVPV